MSQPGAGAEVRLPLPASVGTVNDGLGQRLHPAARSPARVPLGLGSHPVSTISRDDVAKLAKLARLALTDDELDSFAGQLDAILGYVGQIQAVDVTGVAPTGNPLRDVNVTRPDRVQPSLSQQQALAEAPAADEGRFAVPQILGEEA